MSPFREMNVFIRIHVIHMANIGSQYRDAGVNIHPAVHNFSRLPGPNLGRIDGVLGGFPPGLVLFAALILFGNLIFLPHL